MPEFCAELSPESRKILSLLLQALLRTRQVNVASALDVSEATVSRMKESELPKIAKLIDALGLKVVPKHMVVMDQRQIDALLHLAQTFNGGTVNEK